MYLRICTACACLWLAACDNQPANPGPLPEPSDNSAALEDLFKNENEPKPAAKQDPDQLAAAHNERLGGCPECNAGETFAQSEQQVDHGEYTYVTNPTCQNKVNMQQRITEAAAMVGNAYTGNYAGAVEGLLSSPEGRKFLSENVRGTIGQLLSNNRTDTANCQAVCVVVPTNATIVGSKIEAANEDKVYQGCQAGQDCSIGWSKWVSEPAPSTAGNIKAVCGTFANWADNGHRFARLRVFFRPPDDWIPPR